jgi:hypothetical protein
MRQEAPATRVPQQRGKSVTEPTGWAGFVIFGAMMMILLGSFHAIAGLVAIFNDKYYLVPSTGLVVSVDYTVWGWVHLILGLVAIAAGIGLFTGAMWARVTGIIVAGVSAIVNFAFLGAYPVWAITMITLDVLVIYAISAHGREVQGF